MYLCNFSINSNCDLSSTAENLGISIISLYVYPNGKINYVFAFTEFNDIKALKEHFKKDFIFIKLFKSEFNNIIFIYGIKKGHNVLNSITSKGSIPLFPIIAEDGKELFNFVSINKNSIDYVKDNVSKYNDIVNFDCESMEFNDCFNYFTRAYSILLSNKLTKIEKMILKKAYFNGFFNWPRQQNLEGISKTLQLSKPTISYHIRNGERKLLEDIIKNF